MRGLHRGEFNGLATLCDFLEGKPGKLRDGVTADSARGGYTREVVRQALEARHPGRSIEVDWVRTMPMRGRFVGHVDCVVARYRSGRRQCVATLRGRRFTVPFCGKGRAAPSTAEPDRKIWYQSPDGRLTLEEDIGKDHLPGHSILR